MIYTYFARKLGQTPLIWVRHAFMKYINITELVLKCVKVCFSISSAWLKPLENRRGKISVTNIWCLIIWDPKKTGTPVPRLTLIWGSCVDFRGLLAHALAHVCNWTIIYMYTRVQSSSTQPWQRKAGVKEDSLTIKLLIIIKWNWVQQSWLALRRRSKCFLRFVTAVCTLK